MLLYCNRDTRGGELSRWDNTRRGKYLVATTREVEFGPALYEINVVKRIDEPQGTGTRLYIIQIRNLLSSIVIIYFGDSESLRRVRAESNGTK